MTAHSKAFPWARALSTAMVATLLAGCGGGGSDSDTTTPSGGGDPILKTTPVDVAPLTRLDAGPTGANQAIQLARYHVDTVASASWGVNTIAPAAANMQAQSLQLSQAQPLAQTTSNCFADPKTGQIGTFSSDAVAGELITTTTMVWTHCNNPSTAFVRSFRDGSSTTVVTKSAAPVSTDVTTEVTYNITDTWIASPVIGNDVVRTRTYKGTRRCASVQDKTSCTAHVGTADITGLSGISSTDTQTHIGSGTVSTRPADPSNSLKLIYTNWDENSATGQVNGTAQVTDSQGTVAQITASYSNGVVTYTVVLTRGGVASTIVLTN
jgi:hypothetical protein